MPKLLANLIRFVQDMKPMGYVCDGPSIRIYVDASLRYVGYASGHGQVCTEEISGLPADEILPREMFAINSAVMHVRSPCKMEVMTDSQACIEIFRTGRSDNDTCLLLLHQTLQHMAKYSMAVVLSYIESAKNPADAPSRMMMKGTLEKCYWTRPDITKEDIHAFYARPVASIRHGFSTFVFNLL
jgi:hypothetical protein